MLAYCWDFDFYYAGIIDVQKSPFGDTYLLPANATLKSPKAQADGKVNQFSVEDNDWILVLPPSIGLNQRIESIKFRLKAIDQEYGTRSWREYALASVFLHSEAKVKLEEVEAQAQSLRNELATLIL